MAIRIDAAADLLSRTTGLPAFGHYTVMVWIYRVVDQANDEICVFTCQDNTIAAYLGFFVGGTNGNLTLDSGITQGGLTVGTAVSLTTWHHVAMVFDDTANTMQSYLNGVLNATRPNITGSTTFGYEVLGNLTSGGGNMLNGRFAAFKSWTAALTAAEVAQEMRIYLPARTTNLHRCTPLLSHTHLGDLVGGPAWTASGTLTTEPGPPIAWSPRPVLWLPPGGAGTLIALTAALTGTTTTPVSTTATTHELPATLSGASTTPASLSATTRSVLAQVTGTSVTAEALVVLPTVRTLTAAALGTSTTSAPAVTIGRSLLK